MFFQEATPDTSGYMIAGYAITFLVMALYVASMYIRSRNLHQDMTMLEEWISLHNRLLKSGNRKKAR
jgi:hypothetical protein